MPALELRSLADQVEAVLKEEIFTGRLKQGVRVSIGQLSRQLGTSSTPVRDAVQRLAASGFVRVLPRREIRVERLEPQKLTEAFELRIALEGLAVRTATGRIPSVELDRAWHIFSKVEVSLDEKRTLDALLAHDSLVHDLIIVHCGNGMLVALMQGLRDLSRWAQRTVIRLQPEAIAKAVPEHKRILRALLDRDARAAERALISHLRNTLKRTLKQLRCETTAGEG